MTEKAREERSGRRKEIERRRGSEGEGEGKGEEEGESSRYFGSFSTLLTDVWLVVG